MSALQLHEETAGAQASVTPIKRRSRWGWWAALAVAALVALVALRPGNAGEAPTYITETATVGDLEQVVEGTGVVGFSDGDLVTVAPRMSGTVTDVHVLEGSTIEPMSAFVDVDGTTLWAVTGDAPVYRDLTVDAEGSDVGTLEQSLAAAGYDPGEIDEVFDTDTETALEEWQEDNELDVTGRFQVAGFVWAPADSVTLDVTTNPGDIVQPGQSLALAGPEAGEVVRVSVDQADVTSIAVGNEATVDIDGLDESITGTVISTSQIPVDGTDFEVVVALDTSEEVLAGMEGTVSIVVDTLDDVVLIPTGALGGTASAPTVDVLVDGVAETRSVVTGLTTPTQVEVVSGIAQGDQIVIGEVAE